jgi:parvulin-like peptidyl-prolyl isomerase
MRKPSIKARLVFSLLCLCPALFCVVTTSFAQPGSDRVVAKAGDVFISEREFLERFELLPAQGRKNRVESAKMELLYSMIAEKLLAREATRRSIDVDSSFGSSFEEVRKLLARDELYRQEIAAKISISNAEIAQGMERARKRLRISYLFFPTEDEADFNRKQIVSERDFQRIRIDSSMDAMRDTVTLEWGTAEPAIERAAFSLAQGEVSSVVAASRGWYILCLTGIEENPTYTAMTVPMLRSRVQGILRLRKENERLNEFMPEFLRGKSGYTVGRTFVPFTEALRSVLAAPSGPDSILSLAPDQAAELRQTCSAILGDTLVAAGNVRWTVREAIDRLISRSLGMSRSELPSLRQRVNAIFREWVEHELLAQEALRRGLDRAPSVSGTLETWREFYLADAMRERLGKEVSVSEAEAWNYAHSKDQTVRIPTVQIRELRTANLEDMTEAIIALEQGTPFADVVARWSIDPDARKSGGVTAPFPITRRLPVGDLAWRMETGERYGPVPVRDGQLLFELVKKDSVAPSADTSFVSRKELARQELLEMKRKRIVTLFLAQAGKEQGFTVFEDRVHQLEVTEAPMMTYRILGFGGRMFAVPFVDQQLDWLELEPPEKKILP